MKLTDYSDNSAAVDTEPSGGKKAKKRKSPLLIIGIIILLILLLYVAYYLLFKIMYSCNAEPFLENKNLVANTSVGDTYHSYHDSVSKITYQCSTPTFEIGLDAPFIQASADRIDVVLDEQNNLMTDHTIRLMSQTPLFFGSTEYWVTLNELGSSDTPGNLYRQTVAVSMKISHDGELISASGSERKNGDRNELSQDELIEYYDKYSDEIKELLDSLHEFFGEDNFRD